MSMTFTCILCAVPRSQLEELVAVPPDHVEEIDGKISGLLARIREVNQKVSNLYQEVSNLTQEASNLSQEVSDLHKQRMALARGHTYSALKENKEIRVCVNIAFGH